MRNIIFCLFLILPITVFSQDSIEQAKPTDIFEQVIFFSYQVSLHNKESKKYDAQMEKVREIGYRIVSQTHDARPFTFQYIKEPSVNAFALPGGFIFITEGMLKLGLSDDEWAHLLGHEITHVVNNHHERRQKFDYANFGLQIASIALAVLASNQMNSNNEGMYTRGAIEERNEQLQNLFYAAVAGPYISKLLYSLKYSREFEREADLGGRKFSALAGYDPKGAETLFNKLSKSDHHHVDHMWRSHPEMLDRTFAASLAEEKKVEKDFTQETQFAKEKTQTSLLQYALYFAAKNTNKKLKFSDKEFQSVIHQCLVILHLTKLIITIDKKSPLAPKALQVAYEQLIFLQSYSESWPSWGEFYRLYKEVDPENKNFAYLEEKSQKQYKELTDALHENRAGIPVCASLIKNFPNHPEIFAIHFSFVKALFQNRAYHEIPAIFIKTCELEHTSKENKELAKIALKYLKVCDSPYQLFRMSVALNDEEFSQEAKKSYVKILQKCESLKEIIKLLEQETLKDLFPNIDEIKEKALKKTFEKGKLKEKQNLKAEAYQLYNEILVYGRGTVYEELSESALKTLAYE